ncbi:hypothetical protein Q673_15425 [Marinobacter sp. EN3]|jgi:5-methylcytosine-specific restriction endonuclease McrA|uniref:HNH endonuclease n=1 Tax=Marinobacter sp. EN3 TaxID=1397533 RepID=UPI0003B84552|nr:HNH endonuclease [Marinobacter sp. EN3]ERS10108.1 hypothetical protein Q673_15425 [Marinobacter sp. EN3]|tara:strand:- start:803 stop:1627 length:825 start_codon:yes stop_codon:yes gene_type:complete
MSYLNFKPVTSGERLFQHILKEVVGFESLDEARTLSYFKYGGRLEQFGEYFIGAYVFNLTGRCIKKARRIRDTVDLESRHQAELLKFFRTQLEMASFANERNLERLSILAFEAADNSGKKISRSTKKFVRGEKEVHDCYICGKRVVHNSDDLEVVLKYEHIWPSAYGGDSIEENLLPSCNKCNEKKDDMLLWQDGHVHSFILRPDPSEQEWKSIKRREKISKHRWRIFKLANDKEMSLKEAAIEIGPFNVDPSALYAVDEEDSVDFFNFDIRGL